jgi:methyl-accepting chemotaxis protein
MLMNSLVGGSVIGNVIILVKWYGSRNKESGRLEQRQQRYDAAADIVLGKQTGGGQDSLEAKVSRIDRDLRGDSESLSEDERLGVKGKLKQVDTNMKQMEANMKQMETNMKQMETNMKQMETNMKQMDTNMKQMETKIKQMDTNMIVFGTAISLCVGSIAYLNWKSGSGRQGESG